MNSKILIAIFLLLAGPTEASGRQIGEDEWISVGTDKDGTIWEIQLIGTLNFVSARKANKFLSSGYFDDGSVWFRMTPANRSYVLKELWSIACLPKVYTVLSRATITRSGRQISKWDARQATRQSDGTAQRRFATPGSMQSIAIARVCDWRD